MLNHKSKLVIDLIKVQLDVILSDKNYALYDTLLCTILDIVKNMHLSSSLVQWDEYMHDLKDFLSVTFPALEDIIRKKDPFRAGAMAVSYSTVRSCLIAITSRSTDVSVVLLCDAFASASFLLYSRLFLILKHQLDLYV